jgi:hypothetical protein
MLHALELLGSGLVAGAVLAILFSKAAFTSAKKDYEHFADFVTKQAAADEAAAHDLIGKLQKELDTLKADVAKKL